MHENRPWLRFYGKVPAHLEYPELTLYEALAATAQRVPDAIAWSFFGTRSTYAELLAEVDRCAGALAAEGLREGERFLISMPTSPQGVIAFYAANRLGAVPALIHPLSTAPEITHFLDLTGARVALTLDAFYGPLVAATPKEPLTRIVIARISEYLSPLKRLGFWATKGRRIPPVPRDPRVRAWKTILAAARGEAPRGARATDDPAAILFSGGTTGLPKGIVLSNRNFIAQGLQSASWSGLGGNDAILAILPIFHGFGLGVCVNAAFMAGGKSILVPQFSAEIV
jgi:long-chain acyl-CoA synthetase